MKQLQLLREYGRLNVDAELESLTPQQWDELLAVDSIEPMGEARMDLRIAYLVSKLAQLHGIKNISVWDVVLEMRWLFQGHREDEAVQMSKNVDVSRLLTGK